MLVKRNLRCAEEAAPPELLADGCGWAGGFGKSNGCRPAGRTDGALPEIREFLDFPIPPSQRWRSGDVYGREGTHLRYSRLPGTSIPCPFDSTTLGKCAVLDLTLPFPAVKSEKFAKSFAGWFWWGQSTRNHETKPNPTVVHTAGCRAVLFCLARSKADIATVIIPWSPSLFCYRRLGPGNPSEPQALVTVPIHPESD